MDIGRTGPIDNRAFQGIERPPAFSGPGDESIIADVFNPSFRAPQMREGVPGAKGETEVTGEKQKLPDAKGEPGVKSESVAKTEPDAKAEIAAKGEPGGTQTGPLMMADEKQKPLTPLYEIESGGATEEAIHIVQSMLEFNGIKPQALSTVTRDLTALPLPILRLLKSDGLSIAIIREGQSLADTPLIPAAKPDEYRKLADRGRAIFREAADAEAKITENEVKKAVEEGNEDPFHLEMIRYWESDRLKKQLEESLIKENIGFSVIASREPQDLRSIAAARNVPDEDYGQWEATFRLMNEGYIDIADGMVSAKKGVMLIPYTYYNGRPVSEVSLQSYRHYDSKYVKDSLGLHIPDEKLVVLHDDYVTDPAQEVGHYRIVLHEVGHAIDHAIERLPGKGEKHAERIRALYERDKKDLASGGANRFVSPRATDNVREYFAEAVESYMTVKMGDENDYYKSANCHDDLKRINPELFAVLDEIMKSDISHHELPLNPVSLSISLSMFRE